MKNMSHRIGLALIYLSLLWPTDARTAHTRDGTLELAPHVNLQWSRSETEMKITVSLSTNGTVPVYWMAVGFPSTYDKKSIVSIVGADLVMAVFHRPWYCSRALHVTNATNFVTSTAITILGASYGNEQNYTHYLRNTRTTYTMSFFRPLLGGNSNPVLETAPTPILFAWREGNDAQESDRVPCHEDPFPPDLTQPTGSAHAFVTLLNEDEINKDLPRSEYVIVALCSLGVAFFVAATAALIIRDGYGRNFETQSRRG